MSKSLLICLVLLSSLAAPASGQESGYWVVVGSLPESENDKGAYDKIQQRISKCGFRAFNDFSSKFGFKPGYNVFVLGPFATKAESQSALARAKYCTPDAYVKKGAYLGE